MLKNALLNLGADNNVLRSDLARLFVESFVSGTDPLPSQYAGRER